MPKIFVSYRRVDSEERAQRIADWLILKYKKENVFIDVDTILGGADFESIIEDSLAHTDVMLVIIGHKWFDEFEKRADNRQKDFVYREVLYGLENIPTVIPILLERNVQLDANKLPPEIRPLLRHNFMVARKHPDFHRDMEDIKQIIDEATHKPINWKLYSGIVAVIAVLIAAYFIFSAMNNNDTGDATEVIQAQTTEEATPSDTPELPTPMVTPSDTPELPTPIPTVTLTDTPAPPTPTIVITDTPEPFFTPDEDDTFMVGIQVQVPQDLDPVRMNGYLQTAGQDLGLEWAKIQVRWDDVEEEEGNYNFDELDLAMASARFFGVRPLLVIVTAPDWAREPGINTAYHGPPEDNADYVNFVQTILERYEGQVYAIEVWHEQNLSREWTSLNGLRASNYVALLRDTYNMVQEVSPGTIVISGGLAPTGVNDGIGAIDDFSYMYNMIDAGLLDVVDCIGAHHIGYNVSPLVTYDAVPNDPTANFSAPFDNPHHSWSFRSTLEGYLDYIHNAGSDKKLCVTKFGWAVTEDLDGSPMGFDFASDNTLEEQSTYFVDALQFMKDSDNVWLAIIWNLNYGPEADWNTSNDNVPYSLIGPENVFRPAFDSIREWNQSYMLSIGQD